jgi:hypothetical protein
LPSARDLLTPKEVGTLDETEARLLEADGASAGFGYQIAASLGFHL